MKKLVFNFKSKDIKKLKNPRNILGGKGLNLAEMGKLGMPVPPGFTISTEACDFFYKNRKKLNSKIIKEIKFNEKKSLLSEDSLIIKDFLEKGYKAYLSSKIKISYVSRSSIIRILRLFNTYGFCRANTILITKKIFISIRHLIVCISFLAFLFFLAQFSLILLLSFPLFLFSINLLGEIINAKRSLKIYLPFYATLCQFSWIMGFLWSLISIFKKKKTQSNFIS